MLAEYYLHYLKPFVAIEREGKEAGCILWATLSQSFLPNCWDCCYRIVVMRNNGRNQHCVGHFDLLNKRWDVSLTSMQNNLQPELTNVSLEVNNTECKGTCFLNCSFRERLTFHPFSCCDSQ